MKTSIGVLMVLILNACKYSDGNYTKPILEKFKKDYTIITEACRTVGYVKSTCIKQDGRQQVAFTAAVSSSSSTWNSGTLVFDSVISNVGNGYNPKTGVFTAPKAGTFVFSVSAVEHRKDYLRIDLVLNNVSKVRLLGFNGAAFQAATNLVVLTLKQGDGVWVIHSYGKGYYTESVPMTTFSGFLIL